MKKLVTSNGVGGLVSSIAACQFLGLGQCAWFCEMFPQGELHDGDPRTLLYVCDSPVSLKRFQNKKTFLKVLKISPLIFKMPLFK